MRSVILSLVVLGVGTAGTLYWKWPGTPGANPSSSATGRPTTAVVERGAVSFSVAVAGEIGPAEQVSVRPEVNGRILELPVDVGDRVPKDSLLFALDDRDLKLEVETRQKQIESSKLQLDKARIAMDQARRDYERDQELFAASLLAGQVFEGTRQRYESSIKDHELALNSIERAEKDLAIAEERLSRTRIVAPFDCTILTRPVSAGQAVSGSGGFNSGTEVLTIADLSAMVINAHVNQADVTRLRHGMQVQVEVDAVPGLEIQGEVERIAPQATVRNSIKGYTTRIALKDVDPRVQPGMTASISIPVASADQVLTVPLAAVFSEQGERYVYVKTGNALERRDVRVGVSDLFRAEIVSGLSEGEIVALEPPEGAAGRIPGGGPQSTPGGSRVAQGSAPSKGTTNRAAATEPVRPTPVTSTTPTPPRARSGT